MAISDEQRKQLAAELYRVRRQPPKRFAYSVEDAISRAKDGSVTDAKLLLELAAALLRKRGPVAPFDETSLLPAWLADYLADALAAIAKGGDPGKALFVSKRRGRTKYDKEHETSLLLFYQEQLEVLHKVYAEKLPRRAKELGTVKQQVTKLTGMSERTLRYRRQKAAKK